MYHDESYLLSAKACAGADGTQVLLLPLVSHLVRFAVIIAHRIICVGTHSRQNWHVFALYLKKIFTHFLGVLRGLTWFTLELSFSISQASAAHQVTIFCTAVPLFSNAIVVAIVMAPL